MRQLLLLMLLALATPLSAQLPSPSTRALGLADNFTALARGYAAAAWNPAVLGLRDNPRASLAVMPLRGMAGLDPVSMGDLADYQDEFLPAGVREAWLRSIEREGSEQGAAGGDLTYFAAQLGNVAVQAASSARAAADLSPGAAELLLFGNYGRAGEPHAFDLQGSRMRMVAMSTFAVSYGRTIYAASTANIAIGITAKYAIGHVLLFAEDRGTTFTTEPAADIDFPVAGTSIEDFDPHAGSGVGLDIGAAMVRGSWSFGATLQNVVNTFAWAESQLIFRAGLATFNAGTNTSDFAEQPFSGAPQHLKQLIRDARLRPSLRMGIARELRPLLTVTADLHARLGDSTLELEPAWQAGIGAEWYPLRMLPLRGGLALLAGGYQAALGLGVELGPVSFSGSLAHRETEFGVSTITMLSLISTL